jgi:hypothetical protein
MINIVVDKQQSAMLRSPLVWLYMSVTPFTPIRLASTFFNEINSFHLKSTSQS